MEEKSSQKAYERVFDYFTAEITSGSLRLNDKIPTERALSENLKVSRNYASWVDVVNAATDAGTPGNDV